MNLAVPKAASARADFNVPVYFAWRPNVYFRFELATPKAHTWELTGKDSSLAKQMAMLTKQRSKS